MKKLKSVLAVLTAVVMTACMAGCEKEDEKETTKVEEKTTEASTAATEEESISASLKVWSSSEDQADENCWLPVMCEKFKEEHPNWDLSFEYEVCSEADANKMVTQDPSAAADVFLYPNDQIKSLISANALAEFGGDALEEIKNNCNPTIVNSVTVDDGVYGYPFTTNTWYMFYNKSIFNEDDVKNLDTMLSKGKVSFPLSNGWYIASFYFANGGTMYGDGFDESQGVGFGGENGADVTKYLVSLASNPNFVNDDQGSGIAGLRDGSIGAMFSGTWDAKALKEALGDDFGVAVLPTYTLNGSEKQLKSFAGSKAVGVNSNSKNPKVAIELALFLGSAQSQKEHFNLSNVIPANVNLNDDADISADPVVAVQNTVFNDFSVIQPFVPAMGNFWTPTESFGKAIVNKEVNADNAAEKTEEWIKSCANPID